MTHQELVERMRSSKGTIFSCRFVKRSTGELRHMVCRLGVHSHLKGGTHAYDPLEHGLLAVFDMRKKEATRTKNQIDEVMRLADVGKGNNIPRVRGTMWAGYNAVTEFLSYDYGRNADSRLNSLWFGESARTNREALDLALALAM